MTYVPNRNPVTYALPAAGGKCTNMQISPAGDLWMVDFGNGGFPSKQYGIECFDITTNPLKPTRKGFMGQAGGNPTNPTVAWFNVEQIKFVGAMMFATANANGSASPNLVSIDTTNPAAPVVNQVFNLGASATGSIYDLAISADGTKAGVPQAGTGGLKIVDISTPTAMSVLGSVSGGGQQFVSVDGTYWTGPTPYLLTCEISLGQFRIYDVTNPAAPALTGSLALSTGIRRMVVDQANNLVYIVPSATQVVYIVDISNKAAPALIGSLSFLAGTAGDDVPIRIATLPGGKRVLVVPTVGSGQGRITLFDLTVPTAPVYIASVSVAPNPFDCLIMGSYAYVSNRAGAQELLVIPTNTLTVQ